MLTIRADGIVNPRRSAVNKFLDNERPTVDQLQVSIGQSQYAITFFIRLRLVL